jgi:Flp pilus assembly protein TadD
MTRSITSAVSLGLGAVAAALLAGCATGSSATKAPPTSPQAAAPVSGGKAAAAGEAPAVSPRAQRLFEEAVAAPEEFKKLKVPVDWEVLERRWRAVLAAEELPEAWFNLAVVLERLQRPDEARAAYQQALRLRPTFGPAAANLALLEEPADPRRAVESYQALLRRFPDDPQVRVRLASLYLASGQLDDAWRLAREALVRDSRATGAYQVMMRVALERGNPDLAELLALRLQKFEGPQQDASIAAFMGDVQLKRGDEGAAAVQYRKALSLRPDEASARRTLLAMAVKAENWGGVAEQARALLQKEPDNARAHLALGVALRYQGKTDEALTEYDRAEQLAGGNLPEVHLARGIALMKLKHACEPAIPEFRAYVPSAGTPAASSAALQLQRECEQIVAVNRQAAAAAQQPPAGSEAAAKKAPPAAAAPPAKPPVPAGGKPQAPPAPAGAGDDQEPTDPR